MHLNPLPSEPCLRILVEQALEQRPRLRPEAFAESEAFLCDVGVDLVLGEVGRVAEGERPGEHLVHDATERPPVHRRRVGPLYTYHASKYCFCRVQVCMTILSR